MEIYLLKIKIQSSKPFTHLFFL
uniref:Uncharacterized protein n=1 Tax=Anguilla anguilla TaxID=7936 RepID=A0A0E9VUR3_ANGAN